MSNKFLLSLAALGLALNLTACSSGDEKSDVEPAAQQDVENLADNSGSSSGEDAMTSDQLPEDALGNSTAADPNEVAKKDDSAAATPPPADSSGITENDLLTDNSSSAPTSSAAPTETPAPSALDTATSSSALPTETSTEEKPKVSSAPLQKIADKPWKVGTTWFNGVYFARPGDTLTKISKNIYGAPKASLLKKGNPSYKSRQPKPGDKVYYNSPQRPDDSERMLTWYEDSGMQPETYIAKKGDSIRKVSKELLGYDNAWKEVWASNSVNSKTSLDEGTELRYWKTTPVAAAASTTPETAPTPPANMDAGTPPANTAANDFPPPPPVEQAPPPTNTASNELPPPPPPPPPPEPPPQQMAQNDIPPPPPPVENMAPPPPPPPPPPPMKAKAAHAEGTGEALDEDTMTALGIVAAAAAGLAALLVVRRRRKQKEMEQSLGDTTQVGS